MSTNKQAHIRYFVLDKCFRDKGNNYTIEMLVNACNDALFEYYGKPIGVKKRQIYNDILFMEDSLGYNIELERIKDGRKVYYRYTDTSFSICNQPLNTTEAVQLKEALFLLSRFSGLPQFEWIEELSTRLNNLLVLKNNRKIIDFEQNIYLTGSNYISELFLAIYNKKVIKILYQSFHEPVAKKITFHPYYLKQYNCRWFLFGITNESKRITILALDRIKGINIENAIFIESEIDFNEYFDDIIGVTKSNNAEVETIILWIDNRRFPYIETKPLHGSQKIIKSNNKVQEYIKNEEFSKSGQFIELQLILNKEFESLLLSFGKDIKVISPMSLKLRIKEQIEKMLRNYF